ncbi:MAG TPA: acyl-CoA dehydrogenase family protein [Dermatophilaceae bacterium]|nr:acyl-CoA dehydrogenase family protein [Dermatophilaceae bacterium]
MAILCTSSGPSARRSIRAWESSSGKGVSCAAVEISAIKVAVPEMATWVIDRAMQAYGGMGVSPEGEPTVPLAQEVVTRYSDRVIHDLGVAAVRTIAVAKHMGGPLDVDSRRVHRDDDHRVSSMVVAMLLASDNAKTSMFPLSGAAQFIASGASIGERPDSSTSGAYSRLVRPAPNSVPDRKRFHRPRSRHCSTVGLYPKSMTDNVDRRRRACDVNGPPA